MSSMRSEDRSGVKNGIGRLIVGLAAIVIQVGCIYGLASWLGAWSGLANGIISVAAFLLALYLYGGRDNSSMKMPWIILILLFPVFGIVIYLLVGSNITSLSVRRSFEAMAREYDGLLSQDPKAFAALEGEEGQGAANQFRYLRDWAGYPTYRNCDVTYYADTGDALEAQLAELSRAKRFIFMEYFAVEDRTVFSRVLDVLSRKVDEGVEVRLFYDDVGSLGFVNHEFLDKVRAHGIKCRVFNAVTPALMMFVNNRDHRKMTVIDGKVAFTGGYNLADEYFNVTHPYGRWKDAGVRVTGDAVRSFTEMFLQMWNSIRHTDEDIAGYLERVPYEASEPCGFVAPYADTPLDHEHTGENVYMNLVKHAERYCWFMTPYLVITDELMRDIRQAAKSGVDVRIMTPGIPDKRFVYMMTRSYYQQLVEAGVRIFEYSPGFVHSKVAVADGKMAVVGTINLDYRSLYLHFEDAVLMCDCQAVQDIERDFEQTFPVCREVTERYRHAPWPFTFLRAALRIVAPLV